MEVKEHKGYKEFKVSFEEFINILRPDDKSNLKKIIGSANDNFIYRGQSNSTYELVPALYRNVFDYSMLGNSYDSLCFLQLSYLKIFIKGCDFNAVAIPNDSKEFRDEVLSSSHDKVFMDPTSWPNKKMYELLAFAQHYGYPTELLDWSYNPLVAMYFAATGVTENRNSNLENSFSIWIIDTEKTNLLNSANKTNFEIIDVPRAHNINISSQHGCFTLIRQTINSRGNLTHATTKINELKLIPDLMYEKDVDGLIQLTISNSEVLKVIEFCDAYSINAATIFRGPYGAAQFATQSINIARFASRNQLQLKGAIAF